METERNKPTGANMKITRKYFVFDMVGEWLWDFSGESLEEYEDGEPSFYAQIRKRNGEEIVHLFSSGNGYFDLHFADGTVFNDIDSVHIRVVEETES